MKTTLKVSELTGPLLDYWVAKAEGKADPAIYDGQFCSLYGSRFHVFAPSTDWVDGGPIIQRDCIELLYFGSYGRAGQPWEAQIGCDTHYIDQHPGDAMGGETALIAAMRAKVASVYGDEVPETPC